MFHQVDEREAQLRQQWADHKNRFKSGAKRSSLRGVIKSSYLTELGGRPDGRAPAPQPPAAAAAAARKPLASEGASPSRRSDNGDDGWEDVCSTDVIHAALAGACVQRLCAKRVYQGYVQRVCASVCASECARHGCRKSVGTLHAWVSRAGTSVGTSPLGSLKRGYKHGRCERGCTVKVAVNSSTKNICIDEKIPPLSFDVNPFTEILHCRYLPVFIYFPFRLFVFALFIPPSYR